MVLFFSRPIRAQFIRLTNKMYASCNWRNLLPPELLPRFVTIHPETRGSFITGGAYGVMVGKMDHSYSRMRSNTTMDYPTIMYLGSVLITHVTYGPLPRQGLQSFSKQTEIHIRS